MPGSAGAWAERAAAAAITIDLGLEHLAAVGGDAEQRLADLLDRLHHFLQVKVGPNGLICAIRASQRPGPVT
jgi:hypothetical protein